MAIGIGGCTQEEALSKLTDMTGDISPISTAEYQQRIARAQQLMRELDIAALYLNAGTNLTYFTGTLWSASERLVGALLPARGELTYIAPWFEQSTLEGFMQVKAPSAPWHEHESPYELLLDLLDGFDITQGRVALDESSPFFLVDGLAQAAKAKNLPLEFISSAVVTGACRMIKSEAEIALLQRSKDMTLAVHKAAASILRPGITTDEVSRFIYQAHRKVGALKGSSFCIVLFGGDTAYPHGVKQPKVLEENDMVLIDTGCLLHGYHSDITRSYVYGQASERQRLVWQHEKEAQAAAFAAARIGFACENVDSGARQYLESQDYGPDYQVPGLPHRTGHGIGLDIHEGPYLVRGDKTLLSAGMCFSNEPMICLYGEFGVRLEDHFYMTEQGPKWFTDPAFSIDDPFGYECAELRL